MSWRKCATMNCPHHIRSGLRRDGRGPTGIALADGMFCWRCRAKNDREPVKKPAKESR